MVTMTLIRILMSQRRKTKEWNREHVYPRSLGNPNLGSEGPGSDASFASFGHYLKCHKKQLPFGTGSGNSKLINGTSFYPGDEWKGDVARMVMYMYVRYGNQCLPNVVKDQTHLVLIFQISSTMEC
jgi:hypothetical protein